MDQQEIEQLAKVAPATLALLARYSRSNARRHADSDAKGLPRDRPIRRRRPKVGRNAPCPCGSGAKFKKCHGALVNVG